MKDIIMGEWQIAQLFLSETGVHEVDINLETRKLRCNCSGYSTRAMCKHSRFVQERMKTNGGVYPVEVSNKASTSDSTFASLDPKLFRDFLIKYGKIQVL